MSSFNIKVTDVSGAENTVVVNSGDTLEDINGVDWSDQLVYLNGARQESNTDLRANDHVVLTPKSGKAAA